MTKNLLHDFLLSIYVDTARQSRRGTPKQTPMALLPEWVSESKNPKRVQEELAGAAEVPGWTLKVYQNLPMITMTKGDDTVEITFVFEGAAVWPAVAPHVRVNGVVVEIGGYNSSDSFVSIASTALLCQD